MPRPAVQWPSGPEAPSPRSFPSGAGRAALHSQLVTEKKAACACASCPKFLLLSSLLGGLLVNQFEHLSILRPGSFSQQGRVDLQGECNLLLLSSNVGEGEGFQFLAPFSFVPSRPSTSPSPFAGVRRKRAPPVASQPISCFLDQLSLFSVIHLSVSIIIIASSSFESDCAFLRPRTKLSGTRRTPPRPPALDLSSVQLAT